MHRKLVYIGITLFAAIVLAGCAASANTIAGSAGPDGTVAGFWLGLWHGAIALITFIVSLFNDSVGVYEVHNNGNWYNFGFLWGVGLIFAGSGSALTSQAKK